MSVLLKTVTSVHRAPGAAALGTRIWVTASGSSCVTCQPIRRGLGRKCTRAGSHWTTAAGTAANGSSTSNEGSTAVLGSAERLSGPKIGESAGASSIAENAVTSDVLFPGKRFLAKAKEALPTEVAHLGIQASPRAADVPTHPSSRATHLATRPGGGTATKTTLQPHTPCSRSYSPGTLDCNHRRSGPSSRPPHHIPSRCILGDSSDSACIYSEHLVQAPGLKSNRSLSPLKSPGTLPCRVHGTRLSPLCDLTLCRTYATNRILPAFSALPPRTPHCCPVPFSVPGALHPRTPRSGPVPRPVPVRMYSSRPEDLRPVPVRRSSSRPEDPRPVSVRMFSTRPGDADLTMRNELVRSYVKHLYETHREASAQLTSAADGSGGAGSGSQPKGRDEAHRSVVLLGEVADLYAQYSETEEQLEELKAFLEETQKEDPEMKRMLQEDMKDAEGKMEDLSEQILDSLVPPELTDDRAVLVELSSGAGGQEAMLFTSEVLRMYEGLATYRGWRVDSVEMDLAEMGGVRKASMTLSGDNVYKFMKYEGGVHRVQRNPKTERGGRMHTSTMSVAVLPQATEVDVVINTSDLKFEAHRASGAGGQHVNTTDSAVRLTHTPTGVVIDCQETRRQQDNKEMAIQRLRTKLFSMELGKQMDEQQAQRKIQTGTRARNEKIRTYNYQQDRITDHRLTGSNMNNVDRFMTDGEQLDDMIHKLMEASRVEKLREMLEKFKKSRKS